MWLWPRTQWQQSWSYTATVDFVADLLPVSAAVNFQQSRTSWIQLCCQYVPGLSHLSNKPVRNWTLCIPTYNWEVQVENRVPKLANPVSQTVKPSFPQKVAVKTVFVYNIQTLLSQSPSPHTADRWTTKLVLECAKMRRCRIRFLHTLTTANKNTAKHVVSVKSPYCQNTR